ncbi:hypothetical protein HK102_009847, partial [Quaeritorhiza haematococci]
MANLIALSVLLIIYRGSHWIHKFDTKFYDLALWIVPCAMAGGTVIVGSIFDVFGLDLYWCVLDVRRPYYKLFWLISAIDSLLTIICVPLCYVLVFYKLFRVRSAIQKSAVTTATATTVTATGSAMGSAATITTGSEISSLGGGGQDGVGTPMTPAPIFDLDESKSTTGGRIPLGVVLGTRKEKSNTTGKGARAGALARHSKRQQAFSVQATALVMKLMSYVAVITFTVSPMVHVGVAAYFF